MWTYQTLYAGTIRFNILLGATKPISEVTQEELEEACQDANILDFIKSLPEYAIAPVFFWLVVNHCYSGFETNVGGKGSQLSGGQKRMFGLVVHLPHLTNDQSVLQSLGHSFEIPRSSCLMRPVSDIRISCLYSPYHHF